MLEETLLVQALDVDWVVDVPASEPGGELVVELPSALGVDEVPGAVSFGFESSVDSQPT
jgi:hypothetical protein